MGRKRKWFIIVGLIVVTGVFLQFSYDISVFNEGVISSKQISPPFLKDTTDWADSVLKTLTVEEKIGQMLMVAAYPNNGAKDMQRVTEIIKKNNIGGIIFFQGTPQQISELADYYQSISKLPLLIAIDGEWGLGMRLDKSISYPHQMMLGAITDEMLIYQMGKDIAQQLKYIGIHVNFAPVVDVNNNPENPVINSRSFGEIRSNVARKSLLYMKGMQDEGVMAFAKHFPGHGDTKTDSHIGLPVIDFTEKRLDSLELYPFRALINAGVSGVMMGHMNVLSLDTTRNLPSTLSKIIADSLLQQRMNFKGLVVTDAMNMKGVSNYYKPVDANYKAVLAGNDILLMPADIDSSIFKIKNAIDSNEIDLDRIERSARKILKAKQWTISKGKREKFNTDSLFKAEYLLKKQQLIEAAVTVLKNNNNLIPFQNLDTLKIANVRIGTNHSSNFSRGLNLYSQVDSFNIINAADSVVISKLFDTLKYYNTIILSLHSNGIQAASNFRINAFETRLSDSIIGCFPTVLTGFVNPYALNKLINLDKCESIIVSYENDSVTQYTTAQLLFGAIGARGRLPITINTKYTAGKGLDTKGLERLKYVLPLEAGFDVQKLKAVEAIVNDAIKVQAMPGCQVLAARNGKVFYNKSFGNHSYYAQEKVQPEDLYDLASLTKIFATLPCVMKLDGDKILAITDQLKNYLAFTDSTNKGNMKISDILLHQAGLVSWIPFYWDVIEPIYPDQSLMSTKYSEKYPIQIAKNSYVNKHIRIKPEYLSPVQTEEYPYQVASGIYLRKNIADTVWKKIMNSPVENPGNYCYSDLGFYFLYKIVEEISNEPIDQYANSVFYQSIGASSLCYKPLERFEVNRIVPTENDLIFRRQVIQGYVHDPGAAMLGGVCGHAGLFGSANDLAKIMQMYLNGGEYGGKQYLDEKVLERYTSCYDCKNGNRRGLGFDKPQADTSLPGPAFKGISTKSFGHTGFTGTMAWADPETGIVYIFLSNRVYPDALNNQLVTLNVRTRIQKAIYDARI